FCREEIARGSENTVQLFLLVPLAAADGRGILRSAFRCAPLGRLFHVEPALSRESVRSFDIATTWPIALHCQSRPSLVQPACRLTRNIKMSVVINEQNHKRCVRKALPKKGGSGAMAARTGEQFLKGLSGKREIWLGSDKVTDIASHPAFAGAARG